MLFYLIILQENEESDSFVAHQMDFLLEARLKRDYDRHNYDLKG